MREVRSYNKNYQRLEIVDKQVDIHDLIKKADIIITDTSTLIYDALAAKKPVISVSNSMQRKWIEQYADFIQIYRNAKDFYEEMDLHKGKGELLVWIESMVAKQNKYIEECMSDVVASSSELIASDIRERI